MEGKLIEALGTALGLILMYLVALTITWLKARLGVDRQRQLKELAQMAVQFAQQLYGHLGGPDRYEKALGWLTARARAAGVRVTEEQLRGFIEAAVRAAKDQFGDQWGKLGNEPATETV